MNATAANVIAAPIEVREPRRVVDPRAPLATARAMVQNLYTREDLPTLHRWRGDFLHWQDGAHLAVEDAAMRATTYDFLERAETDKGGKIAPTARMVSDVLDALRAATHLADTTEPPCWIEHFPDAPEPSRLLPVANGMLDLDSGHLWPNTPAFFTLGALPVAYDPNAPEPVEWHRFLASLWPDDGEARDVLQEWFGYSLTGDTSQQKIAMIVGPKRAGKGTIARVLATLLGNGNVAAPTLASLTTNFGLAPLIGRRLAIVSDARLSSRADQAAITERLLSVSGEDAVTIDRKHRDAWTGKLDTRFLILSNELPALGDASGALASRFIVLTLVHSFYGTEDTGLTVRLQGELPGILNWALAGLHRLNHRGHFLQPSSSAEAIADMADLGSPVAAFVRERCTIEPGAETDTRLVFAAWRLWCEEHGRDRPGTEATFGRNLKAACPAIKTGGRRDGTRRRRAYVGLRLEG